MDRRESTMPAERGDELRDAIVQLTFVVQLTLTEVASAHDLSLTQLRLLGILRDRTPAMAELAAVLGLDRSSASGLISRAESRGLVRRRPRPEDGRGVQVVLDEGGRALLETLTGPVTQRLRDLSAALTPEERTTLTALVRKVLDTDRATESA